jgi:hypothetical protein
MGFIEGMTIWILALLLLAATAALGHKMGAIHASISLFGILISALLAGPLSGLIRPLLPHLGVQNPYYVHAFAPVIVFVILLILFKVGAFYAHRKVEVYYRYQTSDVKFALWERMNHRLGLCIGPINGLLYLTLLTFPIYDLSYWTTQVATSDEERFPIRMLNHAGHDLEATGMIKVARALDPLPEMYFKMADLAGLLYQNPQLKDRLASYPPFLGLAERDDFKQLGQNSDFQSAWKNHPPINQLIDNPAAAAIWQDQTKLDWIMNSVQSNYDDLVAYLQTGQSPKYSGDKFLGRWDFNVVSTLAMMTQTKPNISSQDMRGLRALWTPAYSNTVFVASADGQAFLKNLPQFKAQANKPTTYETANWQGQWQGDGGNYSLTLTSGGASRSGVASVSNVRMTIRMENDILIFDREN